jgi:hypothetical protein
LLVRRTVRPSDGLQISAVSVSSFSFFGLRTLIAKASSGIAMYEEKDAHGGRYRSCDLCPAYMSALAAGGPHAEIDG